MKRIAAYVLAGAMVLVIAACGTDNSAVEAAGNTAPDTAAGPAFTVDVAELDANAVPENYPLIAAGEFDTAFAQLKAANLASELHDYQDVADLFGVDGAYYQNNDYDAGGQVFKYYGWFADNGVSVIITFKAVDGGLNYYAYSGNGIS